MKKDPSVSLWYPDEACFPRAGDVAERLGFLVRYAVLAPSSHNTQPWRFETREDALELYADRSRGLRVVDPEQRELVISCGAALYYLRLALKHFGYRPIVQVFPAGERSDFLALVRIGPEAAPTPWEKEMFRAIPTRRTNRKPFKALDVPIALIEDLSDLASAEGAWLNLVRGEFGRDAVMNLVTAGNRVQYANPAFRRELASWMRPHDTKAGDGIPGYGLGMGDLTARVGPLVLRHFNLGRGQASKDRRLVDGSPILAVLGTRDDEPPDWLAAGQGLAAILLLARANGVWASFLNQPVEVPQLRRKLTDLLGTDGFPQLLLRMGYGEEVHPTPRRSLEEVLT
jgi:nitroreductase